MITLEQMATVMVGDGNTPNVYFVTASTGEVLAVVTTTQDDAVSVAETFGAYLVEDRLTGIVWESDSFRRFHSGTDE